MAKSDARFGYTAKHSRQDHDLSRPFGFTCCPGMLCPIFADIASPGDTYYIHHDLTFLRTAPLAAPAMVDVKVHYESFFVPLQMVFQPFENAEFALKNLQSSYYAPSGLRGNNLPLLNYKDFLDCIFGVGAQTELHADAFRMADFLDLNPLGWAIQNYTAPSSGVPSTGNSICYFYPNFFPWQLLAYQCIFQYYYRLDDKSAFDNQFCNWDSFYNQSIGGSQAYYSQSNPFMKIHQRPWDFDYFTSMYRSPIVSNENAQNVMSTGIYSDLSTFVNTTRIYQTGLQAGSNSETAAFGPAFQNGAQAGQSMINTAFIRQMFANEKLAMITGRTRKNYDSQVLAHFGVEVPHDVKHDLSMIGCDTFDLHIGEVTSLASTSDAPLGELAGKGYSSGQGRKIKFTAPVHGVIMTIFSIEPKKRYYAGFARQNSIVNVFDLPQPEFDRLGNVPMYRYETGILNTLGHNAGDIIGWKERYYEWKRRAPKVTCAFMKGFNNQYTPDINPYESYFISSCPFGAQTFATSRPDIESRYYIERQAMNALMLVQYYNGYKDGEEENWNATPWLLYARDPFIVDSYEKVTKVSWMSKDGEPIYD